MSRTCLELCLKMAYNGRQLGVVYELNKMIMEYEGKLYGKLGFKQYFDTGKTSKDWDSMKRKIAELNEELSKLRQDAVSGAVCQRELLLDFAEYSENDNTSTEFDECVDNYLDSIKQ